MTKKKIAIVLVVIALIGGASYYYLKPENQPATKNTANTTGTKVQTPTGPPEFNKNQYSLTDPASPWIIANKKRPLVPKNYVPADLVIPKVSLLAPGTEAMHLSQPAATAMEQAFADAKAKGLNLQLASGYRSYNTQLSLYAGYVRTQGQAVADTQSARAGYSEHQTGLAADVEPTSRQCEIEECFGQTPEGKWLATNAYQYGFVIRYTPSKQPITGYIYEPWHIRYVGVALATEMHTKGIETLEEFFGLPAAATY